MHSICSNAGAAGLLSINLCELSDLLQAHKEAEEAAAQAAATEESRQKALSKGKPMFARSLKPLTEPKEVEFHTAKRQRMQAANSQAKVTSRRTRSLTVLLAWTSYPG